MRECWLPKGPRGVRAYPEGSELCSTISQSTWIQPGYAPKLSGLPAQDTSVYMPSHSWEKSDTMTRYKVVTYVHVHATEGLHDGSHR